MYCIDWKVLNQLGQKINVSSTKLHQNRFRLKHNHLTYIKMYWTLELALKLEEAPWPATRDELIDYAIRSGAPLEVIENLQEMEDEGELYEGIEDIWPDFPRKDDFLFNDDEY